MEKTRGQKPRITIAMQNKFNEFLEENEIDASSMPLSEFKLITFYFYKSNYGISIVCKDDVNYELRRSVRIANKSK